MNHDVFRIIEERLQSFSKGKQQIATYILDNPNEAAFQTAALIGKAVGISESTVVRFAGDLGFKGFPEFQKSLQQEAMKRLQTGSPSLHTHTSDSSPAETNYAGAVRELLQCRRVFLLGDAAGSTLFPYCKLWADQTGASLSFLKGNDKDVLFRGLSQMQPGDLLFALLLQEPTALLSFVLSQSKRLGGRNLVLTSCADPVLSEYADVFVSIRQSNADPIPQLSPAAMILHDLFTQCLAEKKETIAKQNRILEEIWNAYETHKSGCI